MRKVADETHGVGEQYLAPRWESHRTNRGIERCEHTRRSNYVRLSKHIEQCGLACVRIPDQRHRRDRYRLPTLPLLCSDPSNIFELLFDVPNPSIDFAPIGL